MGKISDFISYVFNYKKNKVIIDNYAPILRCDNDGFAVYGTRRYKIKRLHAAREIPEREINEMITECNITREYYLNLHKSSMIVDIKPYIEVEESTKNGIYRVEYRIMVGERVYDNKTNKMESTAKWN